MTRINLVDPAYLTDKHLMAEYYELPRIFTEVKKLDEKGIIPAEVKIPDYFVLGNGHMKFFYNKLHWLFNRYHMIFQELVKREFNLDYDKYEIVCIRYHTIHHYWKQDYRPMPEDIYLSMVRIVKMSKIDSVLKELKS